MLVHTAPLKGNICFQLFGLAYHLIKKRIRQFREGIILIELLKVLRIYFEFKGFDK